MSTNIDVDELDFAFQPIVNTYSGKIFAVEALLRNTDKIGFQTIESFFDTLSDEKKLFDIDILLRKKAIKKFSKINLNNLKLFYNLDNRVFFMPDYKKDETNKILKKYKINPNNLCFEITEYQNIKDIEVIKDVINRYKTNQYNIAIDDFGTGVSGLHLLYIADTNFIKIDRFLFMILIMIQERNFSVLLL